MQVHNNMAITYLNSIKRTQYVNIIRLRVSRVWRPKKFQTESFDGLHYVLIDEKGDSIHAIVDEHDVDHTEKMKEGCIYDIYHVHVKHNSFGYKVLDRELEIGFNEMSKIVPLSEDSCSIPKSAFEFLQYDQVEECYNRQLKEDKEQNESF
ncbi:hypothetical protein M0R45_025650 [Rubus argutus]|uniref:Replication protein A 70 kDa DNA-binding subunit B/D first OB fold domain-containing protein n=1 Tax=Rubus argutus TaxID=59490 RepID=A0AAW1WWW8_RUBAR